MFLKISQQKSRTALIIALLLSLTACELFEKPEEPIIPAPVELPKPVGPSPAALKKPAKIDILFAQTALKQLGYKIGQVDGFWGKRSKKALQEFEIKENLVSAGGNLSKLNLYALGNATTVNRAKLIKKPTKKSKGLISKIDRRIPLSKAPQLIIVDQPYNVMAKANPYSRVINKLKPGTGIYVLSIQAGWFEIESLTRQRGFIKEN